MFILYCKITSSSTRQLQFETRNLDAEHLLVGSNFGYAITILSSNLLEHNDLCSDGVQLDGTEDVHKVFTFCSIETTRHLVFTLTFYVALQRSIFIVVASDLTMLASCYQLG